MTGRTARAMVAATVLVVAAGSFVASANIRVPADSTTRPPQGTTSSRAGAGNGALSASVYGLWMTHFDASGTQLLDVLVLFRGQPGSVLQPGPHGGGSEGRGANQSARVVFAGLTFTVDYVAQPAAVDVNGKHFSLVDGNVLLFDHVDTAKELETPARQRLDPRVDGGRALFDAIGKTPAVREFLRCGAPLSDPNLQRVDSILCARFAGRQPLP